MIIDLDRFVAEERPYWDELDSLLVRVERDPGNLLDLPRARRLHYLYQRATSDLARIMTFSAEQEHRQYLETLVARAYAEIHETRQRRHRFAPIYWLMNTLPQTFRRQLWAFNLAVAITMVGVLFGGLAILGDESAKATLMPFPHLMMDPSERVAAERETFVDEADKGDPLAGNKTMGTAFYITNNTKVAFTTMALGASWGIGTIIVLFSNGVMLGAVCLDYVKAGESVFLASWLLPHGATEIPAIVIAGQAGLVLGRALIGWGTRASLRMRLRSVVPDIVTLIGAVTLLLIWAGIIEAFVSQYHFVIPAWLKISFGLIQLVLLGAFFGWCGKEKGTLQREIAGRPTL